MKTVYRYKGQIETYDFIYRLPPPPSPSPPLAAAKAGSNHYG